MHTPRLIWANIADRYAAIHPGRTAGYEILKL
jgi:hypothetical protein